MIKELNELTATLISPVALEGLNIERHYNELLTAEECMDSAELAESIESLKIELTIVEMERDSTSEEAEKTGAGAKVAATIKKIIGMIVEGFKVLARKLNIAVNGDLKDVEEFYKNNVRGKEKDLEMSTVDTQRKVIDFKIPEKRGRIYGMSNILGNLSDASDDLDEITSKLKGSFDAIGFNMSQDLGDEINELYEEVMKRFSVSAINKVWFGESRKKVSMNLQSFMDGTLMTLDDLGKVKFAKGYRKTIAKHSKNVKALYEADLKEFQGDVVSYLKTYTQIATELNKSLLYVLDAYVTTCRTMVDFIEIDMKKTGKVK